MAIDLLLQKVRAGHDGKPGLLPIDPIGDEALRSIPDGEILNVKATRARNPKHHRKAFALLNEVFKSQNEPPQFATLDHMLEAIKVSLGHFDQFAGIDGKPIIRPRSISFSAMPQEEFEQFYERMVDLIVTRIIPGTSRRDLEQRVYEILGGPTPADLERR